MTKLEALRKFFGEQKPLTSQELIELRKTDPKGFDDLAELAAKSLGQTITQS